MIYVKLERKEGLKNTCEVLELNPYAASHTHDRIIVSRSCYGSCGFTVTESDFERLYREEEAQSKKQEEAKRTKEESEQQKELAELRAWKAEMTGKNFIQQVFALWRMRMR